MQRVHCDVHTSQSIPSCCACTVCNSLGSGEGCMRFYTRTFGGTLTSKLGSLAVRFACVMYNKGTCLRHRLRVHVRLIRVLLSCLYIPVQLRHVLS